MYHIKDEKKLAQEAEKQRQREAASKQSQETKSRTDEQVQTNLEENGCGWVAGAIESCFKGIAYAVCCCGCCTSYEDFYDGFGE